MSPQLKARPSALLQKIMSDADYDYLGRNGVNKIADTLSQELKECGYSFSEQEWNEIQIKF